MDIGAKRMAAKDFAGALVAFQGADAIMGLPTTGLGVGRAQDKLGKLVEARDTLLRVGRLPKSVVEVPALVAARSDAAELAKAIAARIPSLRLVLRVVNGQAELDRVQVHIDLTAVPVAALALPQRLNPGAHTVVVSAGEQKLFDQELKLAEGEHRTLTIELDAARLASTATIAAPPVPTKTSEPPPPPPPPLPDRKASSPLTAALIAGGFSLVTVGVVVGTVTGAISLSESAELEQSCPDLRCTSDKQSEVDRVMMLANVANVSFALAALGGAVGVTGVLLLPPQSQPAKEPAAGGQLELLVGLASLGLRVRLP